jgi:hypothetical protein
MKTMEFNTALWNVRSMLQAGKKEKIADELKRFNIQITLQELRCPYDFWIKKKNFTLLYSGSKPQMGNMEQDSLLQALRQNAYLILKPLMRECVNWESRGSFII